MSAGTRFSAAARAELEEIASHYPERRAAMLPALWIAQREYDGKVTPEAIGEVAELLGCPAVEVEGVATFYSMYNVGSRGKRHIEVCACLTCACLGAAEVLAKLEERLGIKVGGVTSDGQYSLAEAECLNWCSEGPVLQVGGRYYGNVTSQGVDGLLEQLAAAPDADGAAQADMIVRLHIGQTGASGEQGSAPQAKRNG